MEPTPLTQEESIVTDPLERVEKALERMTDGEWVASAGNIWIETDPGCGGPVPQPPEGEILVGCSRDLSKGPTEEDRLNAYGIATLRNEVSALVKELRARRTDKPCEDVERDRLAEHVAQLKALQSGGVWLWQGDEHDDVDSLACPVLMSADQARTLVAELKRLRGALKGLSASVRSAVQPEKVRVVILLSAWIDLWKRLDAAAAALSVGEGESDGR